MYMMEKLTSCGSPGLTLLVIVVLLLIIISHVALRLHRVIGPPNYLSEKRERVAETPGALIFVVLGSEYGSGCGFKAGVQ